MSREEHIDRDVIRRIVEDENRVTNPYDTLDTLEEKLKSLKPHLVSVARAGDFTTYWELKDEVGIHTSRQGRLLGVLGWHEDEVGEPPLPALVTDSDAEMPSDGYFTMVEKANGLEDEIPTTNRERLWLDHVERVREGWQDEKRSTLERYYFVASSTFGTEQHTILHGDRNCQHIDHVGEGRLAVLSGSGAELKQSGNFGRCRDCTTAEDGVFP